MRALLHRVKSDESLIAAYLQGDVSAFDVLYSRHTDALFTYLVRRSGDRQAAQDAAQEAWMAAIDSLRNYRPSGSFKSWLFRVGRNKLIDQWRRNPAAKAEHTELESADAAQPADAERAGLRRDLVAALRRLPDEQRETFILLEEGFSRSEIAEITGAGQETVKSRLRYARKQLRAALEVN